MEFREKQNWDDLKLRVRLLRSNMSDEATQDAYSVVLEEMDLIEKAEKGAALKATDAAQRLEFKRLLDAISNDCKRLEQFI